MNKIIAAALAASIALSASTAFAGGPVIVEAEEVVAEKPASSIGVLPLLLGAIIIGAVLLNNDDDESVLP